MKKITFALTSALLVASSATAAVTINFNVDSVRDSVGGEVATTGLGLIIADTTNDGFGAITPGAITAGSLVGTNDLVVYRADFSTFATPGVWSETASNLILSNGWSGGNQLAFVWFPTLTILSSSATEGSSYGILTSLSWVTPSDGGTSPFFQVISDTNVGFFGSNATTESITDMQSRASLIASAVPEPSTFGLLFGLSALGLVTCRRGKRA